jgi:malonyl-CoA O-methyltransferase
MTLHWVSDPLKSLERLTRLLAPDGVLLCAALGSDSFSEWRAALAAEDLPIGLVEIPPLPGIVAEDRLTPDGDALSFLRRIKAVGGLTPREGYVPLSPGALRRAIRLADVKFGGCITWHIVYGRLNAPEASRSRPSTIPA